MMVKKVKTLGVVLARGGSKRVPGKNLRQVGGRTLLERTLEAAQACDLTDVVVSSDDPLILSHVTEISDDIILHLRTKENSSDTATSQKAILEVLKDKNIQKPDYDAVVLLQPTSPFRRPETISRMIEQFVSQSLDSMVAVGVLNHKYVPTSIYSINDLVHEEGCSDLYILRDNSTNETASSTKYLYRNGSSCYITKFEKIAEYILGGRTGLFLTDEIESVDIDTEFDLMIAEGLSRQLLI